MQGGGEVSRECGGDRVRATRHANSINERTTLGGPRRSSRRISSGDLVDPGLAIDSQLSSRDYVIAGRYTDGDKKSVYNNH